MIARYQLGYRIRRVMADIEKHLNDTGTVNITIQFGQIEMLKRIEEGVATIKDRVDGVASSSSNIVASTSSSNAPQRLSSFQKPRYIAGPHYLFQKLLIAVEERGPSRIGVVGKTLLLRRLEESCKIGKNLVLWLTISQNPSILSLRGELGKQLSGENWSEKRYALFLDDVWEVSGEELLENLRVPVSEANCSKIIVSTSENRVLLKLGVKPENTCRMEGLDREDSWRLFCSHAFPYNDLMAPVGLKEIAKHVCRGCKGLPLAIKVVRLCQVPHNNWSGNCDNIIGADTQKQVFDRLKLSYDALASYDLSHQHQGTSLRLCFLYLGAFEEDQLLGVEDLIKLWIGEGLLGTWNGDVNDPLDIGQMHVNLLLDRCLIEARWEDYSYASQVLRVSVHDVLHDLARQIAASEENCIFRAGKYLKEFPADERSIINSTRISLMDNQLRSIPETFRGTAVRALLLSRNRGIDCMPARVMRSLTSVRVLDLSGCKLLRSLPESLRCMKRLVYLNLSHTGIKILPASITRLKRLQLLDLSNCSQLRELPAGLDKLTSLWYLNASYCGNLKRVSSRLSMLISLRHLNMSIHGNENLWIEREKRGRRATRWEEGREVSGLKDALHTLTHLTHLEITYGGERIREETLGSMVCMKTLCMDLPHVTVLPDDMSSMSQLRQVTLRYCFRLVKIPPWICALLYLDTLKIIVCINLEELPALHKLERLRCLIVEGCVRVKELPGKFGKKGAFPALESFTNEWTGTVASIGGRDDDAFAENVLDVITCQNVKELRVGVFRLKGPREMDVSDCPMLVKKMREGREDKEIEDHHFVSTYDSVRHHCRCERRMT